MLDEEMDHIIRDAAENHHPPYNDKAWEMMEKKLDKHLPQKRDRRKFIFFLLFFLLLGGGTVFTVFQNDADKEGNNIQVRTNEKATGETGTLSPQHDGQTNMDDPGTGLLEDGENGLPVATTQQNVKQGNSTAVTSTQLEEDPGKSTPVSVVAPVTAGSNPKNDRSIQPGIAVTDNENPAKKKKPFYNQKGKANTRILAALPTTDDIANKPTKEIVTKPANDMMNKPAKDIANIPSNDMVNKSSKDMVNSEDGKAINKKEVNKKTDGKLNITVTAPGQGNNEDEIKPTGANAEIKTELTARTEEKKETVIPVEEAKAEKEKDSAQTEKTALTPPGKKKPGKNIAGNFGITVSAGPDMSFISLNKPGKTTITYGAGISYHFAKRFTVRSGFYVSSKKYTSTPEQYQGVIYPYLTEIGADCKVYEIPLSLSYHFGQRKNHNWFGNIGLSSYIMKNEDYDYRYKTPTGQTYNYKHSVSNENKHYFSVLTLSGGYQYHFSKRVSMQAEPYLQLPLGGVGLGKIKLNSTGILFTLTVKPFAK